MRAAKWWTVLNIKKKYRIVNSVNNICWPDVHVCFQIVCTVLTYIVCVWEIPRILLLGSASVELIALACKHKLTAANATAMRRLAYFPNMGGSLPHFSTQVYENINNSTF